MCASAGLAPIAPYSAHGVARPAVLPGGCCRLTDCCKVSSEGQCDVCAAKGLGINEGDRVAVIGQKDSVMCVLQKGQATRRMAVLP